MGNAGIAGNVSNWLTAIWQVAWNGSQANGEVWLNFVSPLTVTDNPNGGPDGAGSLDISVGSISFVVTGNSAGSTQLPSGYSSVQINGDANAGSQTFVAPATSIDGDEIAYFDASLSTSNSKTVSFTDTTNGFKFQDPDQPASLVTTYTLTTPRNLSWTRVTCARTATTFWAAS